MVTYHAARRQLVPPVTATNPHLARARATLASRTARFGPGHPDTVDARRDFVAERLAAHIREVVDAAPPLTGEQRAALASLLCSETAPATRP